MSSLATVFGIIGNIMATGLFLSPLPTFKRICKEKSTGEFSWLPYAITFMNCLLWVWYGLPWVTTNIPVLSINAIGTVLQFIYICVFFSFAPQYKRVKILPCVFVIVVLLAAVVVITLVAWHTTQARKLFVGVVCVVFTTCMYVSPLAVMKLVITTRSVEYMPFSLSFFVLANSSSWAVYGLLTSDIFVITPNGIGALLGAIQLVLYAIYSCAKPKDQHKGGNSPGAEASRDVELAAGKPE